MREDDVLNRRVEQADERQNRWLAERLEEFDKKQQQNNNKESADDQPPGGKPSIPPVFVPAGGDPYEKEMEYEPQSPRLMPGTPPGTPPVDSCFEISDDEAEMVTINAQTIKELVRYWEDPTQWMVCPYHTRRPPEGQLRKNSKILPEGITKKKRNIF